MGVVTFTSNANQSDVEMTKFTGEPMRRDATLVKIANLSVF